MRYHVISLVAVFLALGIGILLGVTVVERGLISEQKAQIKSLRKTFDEIKEKNAQLNDDLTAYKRFADETKKYMISGRLVGRQFALLTAMNPDLASQNSVMSGITEAGGSVPVVVDIAGSGAYKDQAVVANLNTLFAMQGDARAVRDRVYAEVVNQLRTASNVGIMATLEKLGVLKMNGTLQSPMSGGILLGGIESDSLDRSDVPLIKSFQAAGFPLVGVAGTGTPDFVLITYKENGISTVDHIETVPGQVAVVLVLEGRGGNFGSGESAGRLMPEPVGL